MKLKNILLLFLSMILITSCMMGQFREALEKGQAIPSDQVLVIGKFAIDPPVDQGNIVVQAPRGTHKGVIKMNFGDNADSPLDKEAMVPFSATEVVDWNIRKTSFVPMPPGTRYARIGTVMLDSQTSSYGVSRGGAAAPPDGRD
jgi:hypothetical protein